MIFDISLFSYFYFYLFVVFTSIAHRNDPLFVNLYAK